MWAAEATSGQKEAFKERGCAMYEHFIRAASGWIQKENGSMHMAVLLSILMEPITGMVKIKRKPQGTMISGHGV